MRHDSRLTRLLRSSAGAFALLALAAPAAADEKPTLTVYTYESFVSEWGPGPAIEKAFEAQCGCDLDMVAVESGAALLSRLKLEGEGTKADLVLGLDFNLLAEAKGMGVFAPHGQDLGGLDLPIEWTDEIFVPYDWSYFAFVYDGETMAAPPTSLKALIEDSDAEILIQDPRTSTPGLGLMLWVKSIYGDAAGDAWAKLRPRIVTVADGWSESYELFLKGEAPMVLSYSTSPAYHRIAEGEDRYKAAPFDEGHYMQVEVAAKIEGGDEKLADQFLEFMLSPAFQEVIPTTNWMYPAVMPEGGLPAGFDTLIQPNEALVLPPEAVNENRRAWTDEWLRGMSR